MVAVTFILKGTKSPCSYAESKTVLMPCLDLKKSVSTIGSATPVEDIAGSRQT